MTSPSSMHEAGHSKPGALGKSRGMGWEGRWEWGSGWGTRAHPWLIRVDVW